MGSGLILLVIVGAWLAVLVPMALRSYDATAGSSRSTERFSDAMRVLSPRDRRPSASHTAHPVEPPPALEPLLHALREDPPRPPLTLVARRRRVLLSLLAVAATGLLGGLLSGWLLVVGLVAAALAVAYVVHLRRLAVARAAHDRRADVGAYWETDEAHDAWDDAWDAWVPARMPARPVAPALRYEDPLPLAAGDDDGWSPVPVPPPVYVGKPVAPRRPPRVLDLTEPGRWSDAVTAGELGDEPDLELDDILDGRRAVGDW
ncbi:MAG: putative rane protein [Frankiales bacterium]|nr:putative rane protein [Frankiales bacterium]